MAVRSRTWSHSTASLDLEIRVPWGCLIQDLVSEITSHALHGNIVSCTTHNPSMTDPSSRLVAVTCREIEKVQGGPVFPIVQWAASDARHLRLCGFNVIEYGPVDNLTSACSERTGQHRQSEGGFSSLCGYYGCISEKYR